MLGTPGSLARCVSAMPGCRSLITGTLTSHPRPRVELRRYICRGAKVPRACNDNRRAGVSHAWYWVLVVGAMPTLGLLAILSSLL
jgi:hypothetical protein